MKMETAVILWLPKPGPPSGDAHHTAPGIFTASIFLGCRPSEVYEAIIHGTDIGGWFADLADPRQVEGGALARMG